MQILVVIFSWFTANHLHDDLKTQCLFSWVAIPSMPVPRFQATALADNDDNLWVFGGTYNDEGNLGTAFWKHKMLLNLKLIDEVGKTL